MILKARFNRSGRGQHIAFTLVELLVVITIMAALVALSASAVLKFVAVQQTTNTRSSLDRVQSQLIKAWSKVKDQAAKEPIPANIATWMTTTPTATNPLVGTDVNAAKRMRVLYIKLKLRQAFPMNFAEALNVPYTNPSLAASGNYGSAVPPSYNAAWLPPPPLGALPAYTTYLGNHGISVAVGSQAAPDPRESAVCLLMALQRGVSGAGIDPAELTSGGAAGDYNGMPYLNDAWGRPIFFSRVPAGSSYLNFNPFPGGGQPGSNDPLDPEGLLQTPGWASAPASNPPLPTPQGLLFVTLTQQVLAGPNSSYKLAPMLASGGPSDWTKPGLGLTFNPVTFAPLPSSDAIFSTP